jgi:1,3-beta-galactosyl-N-acetylhexosamine phosphorylase
MTDTGRLTIPAEEGAEAPTLDLIRRLGADAVRNSDGTQVPEAIAALGLKRYGKYFVNRGDLDWAAAHPEALQEIYLLSRRVTATSDVVEIDLLAGYFTEQVQIDTHHDPELWWEVTDRTTGRVVPPSQWEFHAGADAASSVSPLAARAGRVRVQGAVPWHEYTCSFLAFDVWDPVQMYNHLTNDWGDKAHEPPYDNFHPSTRAHALTALRTWLADNPGVDVVRFTTFFYQFTLVFNDQAQEKYVDWFGYSATVSPAALDAFAEEYGYRLGPEDFVDAGYYNTYFRSPSARWRDWMAFVGRFVTAAAQEFVTVVHEAGREAMMFLGDQWIGTEPYGPDFASIGLDAVVGSVGNGTTLRMVADIPGVHSTEGRLLPYFFPDTFHVGGDPAAQARTSWIEARRAMLRRPVDRIGYGGYPSLAVQFPDFVAVAEQAAGEFRSLHARRGSAAAWVLPRKVAILNAWGRLRAWQTHMVAHALPYPQTEAYAGVLESLSGLPVDLVWLTFDEVADRGVPDEVGTVLIAGAAGTAFSGGAAWADPALAVAIRRHVAAGGGLIGVGEPSAHLAGGRTFQLADVLGVDQEVGFSLSTDKYARVNREHPVAAGLPETLDIGRGARDVYPTEAGATVVRGTVPQADLAIHTFGQGRAAYAAGLPYSPVNSRLLARLIAWTMGLNPDTVAFLPDNPAIEVAYYPTTSWCAVVNNSTQPESGSFRDEAGTRFPVTLAPGELAWLALR